jgi:predicted DNA-binding protein with PD1-like motif
MNSKLLHRSPDGQRTWAVIFDTGDEVMTGLKHFAAEQRLAASQFTAIGAFSDATLAYFDWTSKQYQEIPVREQVEVLILAGDVAEKDSQPAVHAHCVLGRFDGSTRGGHLLQGHVRPTLEVVLTESPTHLRKTVHDDSGLALIDVAHSGNPV